MPNINALQSNTWSAIVITVLIVIEKSASRISHNTLPRVKWYTRGCSNDTSFPYIILYIVKNLMPTFIFSRLCTAAGCVSGATMCIVDGVVMFVFSHCLCILAIPPRDPFVVALEVGNPLFFVKEVVPL